MSFNLGHIKGADGKGITSITKTGTQGNTDIYTILYTDGTTSTFTVTNGSSGADIVTEWESTLSDSKVPSEKLVKNTIDNKASTNHSHGNLTRDGKVGSTSGKAVITGTGGVLETSSLKTINNESILGSGNISVGGGGSADIVTEWESTLSDSKVPSEKLTKNTLDGKVNTSDIVDNLTTNDATKVLSAKQGKVLNDLIGTAINYINL